MTAGNINDTNTIKVVTPSVHTKDATKTTQIYVQQLGYVVEKGSKKAVYAKLTANKDYKVEITNTTDSNVTVRFSIPEKGSRYAGTAFTKSYGVYKDTFTDLKIAGISENIGYAVGTYDSTTVYPSSTTVKDVVSWNSAGKYFEYKGTSTAVLPKVITVTATVGNQKNVVIDPKHYDVTFTPVWTKNSKGSAVVGSYGMGNYTITVTIKDDDETAKIYPTYTSVSATYQVSQANK